MAIDANTYKDRLQAMLEEITKELETVGVHNPDNPADWVERGDDMSTSEADLNDVADRTEDFDERRATLAVLETRYNNIRRALAKIEAGTFGKCEACGAEIEEDRLDANPAARTDKAHMDEEKNLPQ